MKTTDDIRIQSQKDPAQLEREIDQQRNHITELVEALGDRLSPGEMFERVLGYGKEGGREFAGNLSHTIKSNPVPALLTAAGMLWLYTGSRHDSDTTATGTTADLGTHKPDLGERMQHVRQGASEKVRGVRRTAHDAADSARDRAQRANEGFHHMLEDNPMALGAMGIAAGALLGAMLPITRKEHELMGEASDHLTREAREIARGGQGATARRSRGEATSGGDGDQHPSSRPGMGTGINQSRQQPPST